MKGVKAGLRILATSIGVFLLAPSTIFAHVGYVINQTDFVSHEGLDIPFLINGVREAPGVVLTVSFIVLFLVLVIAIGRKQTHVARFLAHTRSKLASYHELLPWMARLSLGIALIGAGTAEVFISPVLAGTPKIAFLEILLGFLFLSGFLLTPAFLITIGLFISGLLKSAYLVGNMDFLALALSLFFLSSGRPGLDDILGIKEFPTTGRIRKLVPLILRVGLGVAFIYLAVYEKLLNPHDSELVVNAYNLTSVIPVSPALWVLGAGLTEFILGLFLIIGFEVRMTAMVSFLVISLSFFYFKEAVYSHVTLFGALSMLVALGAGPYSLDRLIKKRE